MGMIGIILAIVALGLGIAGGTFFYQTQQPESAAPKKTASQETFYYTKFDKPLIVPIFAEGRAAAMLIAEIWIETVEQDASDILQKKPRLRDEFLQVFSYYSSEGKLGTQMMKPRIQAELRRDLTKVAKRLIGDNIHAVLLNDLQRQDL